MKAVYRIVLSDEYIAEAQRVNIGRHWITRFMYQMWWTWWIPRCALTGFVVWGLWEKIALGGVFYAMVGVILLGSAAGELLARRSLARARARARHRGSMSTVTMSDEGIDIVGEYGNSHLTWSGLRPPVVRPEGILLPFAGMTAFGFPIEPLWKARRAMPVSGLRRASRRRRRFHSVDLAAHGAEWTRGEASAVVARRVSAAREAQKRRQGMLNAALEVGGAERQCLLSDEGREMLQREATRLRFSGRAYHRLLRVARTITALRDRYVKELRPYLPSRVSWHDKTLELWMEMAWPSK